MFLILAANLRLMTTITVVIVGLLTLAIPADHLSHTRRGRESVGTGGSSPVAAAVNAY
jgi:hypothetical protein